MVERASCPRRNHWGRVSDCGGGRYPLTSGSQTFDIDARVGAPLHGGEIAVLRGSLAYQRDTLRWKCSGLTQEQLAQRLPPGEMTLGGLMKHLGLVESQWFDHWWRDAGFAPPFDTLDWEADDDWEFRSARDDSPEELRALFDEAVRRSDAVIDDALAHGGLEMESVNTSPQTGRRSPCAGSWCT
jgi:hypothetical protein